MHRVLFLFLKYTVLLLSAHWDISHFPLIPSLRWRRDIIYWNMERKKVKVRESLSLEWSLVNIGSHTAQNLGGSYFSGLGAWGRRLNISPGVLLLKHRFCNVQDVLEVAFFCCQVNHLKQVFKKYQKFHFNIKLWKFTLFKSEVTFKAIIPFLVFCHYILFSGYEEENQKQQC